MSDNPTRDEVREIIKDKLEAVEARLEAKLVGIDLKIELMSGKIGSVLEAAKDARSEAKEAKTAAEAARSAANQTKWNILFTGVGIAAVIVALWAIWSQAVEFGNNLGSKAPPAGPPPIQAPPSTPAGK